MKNTLWSGMLLVTCFAYGQQYEYVYLNKADSTTNCYLKVIPEKTPVQGLIVRDYSSLPDTAKKTPYQFTQLAAREGFMTIFTVSSGFYPELFYSDSCIYLLDAMVAEVVKEHAIPRDHIFAGGMSASGTRALRYAQFCEQGKSIHGIHLKGVFAVDSPLDLARFYNSATQHQQHFKDGMLEEARMIADLFPQKLGGTPDSAPQAYLDASVFSHADSLGGNAKFLLKTHILLIHEPDIDWWTEARGASYYDINSFDIAACYLKLLHLGNPHVTLITTTGKGYDGSGKRNCHSWTIVDEVQLVQWLLDQIQ